MIFESLRVCQASRRYLRYFLQRNSLSCFNPHRQKAETNTNTAHLHLTECEQTEDTLTPAELVSALIQSNEPLWKHACHHSCKQSLQQQNDNTDP